LQANKHAAFGICRREKLTTTWNSPLAFQDSRHLDLTGMAGIMGAPGDFTWGGASGQVIIN